MVAKVQRLDDGTWMKTFDNPIALGQEWYAYDMVSYATPRVVKLLAGDNSIIVEAGEVGFTPTATEIDELAYIIERLAGEDLHHRDIHPGNIVRTGDGIKIIDWETAVRRPGRPYDLFGPVDVPVPVQHGGLIPQWWGSNDLGSIKNKWGVEPPNWLMEKF